MDISELENYYGTTEGCLINLHSQMVNDQIIASQEEAAKKLGIASGFISKIVERSLQARKEGMDPGFPLELLAKHGLSPGQLITSENNNHVNSVNLEPVIKELVDVATVSLTEGLALIKDIPNKDPFIYSVSVYVVIKASTYFFPSF